ncbi:hypothetical protein PHJA_002432500 [Phtheirospermum japonicum]|uniref:Uncharacterized protein n=1 Tax=Phtheirospermum japonicum TaxID=374723 RepID=A0A830CUQ1_9LAMI|nr:hypothetical protein PHJA_002432500 [Phtheirospermum japonicum]
MTRFRSQMLLVLSGGLTSVEPKCSLCCQHEYTPNLNYVACEVCRVWFHADALGVGDDEIGNIIRLKCHVWIRGFLFILIVVKVPTRSNGLGRVGSEKR